MTTMKRIVLVMAAVGALAVPTAVDAVVPPAAHADFVPQPDDDPTLLKAWERWDAKSIEDYTLHVQVRCFCPVWPAVKTVVRGGEIRRVTRGPEKLSKREGYSVDRLYSMIRRWEQDADHLEVTYTSRGLPKSISVDPRTLMVDEERYYSVRLVRNDR